MRDAVNSGDPEIMKAAVRLNWRLWTIFQADLFAPTCEVPTDIRQNVLSLAKFVDKHSIDFMGDPKAERVDVLININREISGGLYDGAVASQAQAQDPNNRSSEQQALPSEPSQGEQAQPVEGLGGLSDIEA